MFLTAIDQRAAATLSEAGFERAEDIIKALLAAGFRLEGRPEEPRDYPAPNIDKDLIERMGKSMDGPWPRT